MTKRKQWTAVLIEAKLRHHIERWGRMPSVSELRLYDGNALACVISRREGFRFWAQKMGAEIKTSETEMAQRWELHELEFFRGHGCATERQSTRAPFDLLINQHRVDVKTARTSWVRTTPCFTFANLKRGENCDFFDLLCINDDGTMRWRFVIPAEKTRVRQLALSCASGQYLGMYAQYLDAIGPLLKSAP